jgi:hypothetical protein
MRYATRFQKEFVRNEISGGETFAGCVPALIVLEEAGIGISDLLPDARGDRAVGLVLVQETHVFPQSCSIAIYGGKRD